MKKKILVLMVTSILSLNLISCAGSEEKIENNSKKMVETEQKSELNGDWAKDYSLDKVKELNEGIMGRVSELTDLFGIEYERLEETTQEGTESVNVDKISFENLSGENDRIESMFYGLKVYGTDMSAATLSLKISFKIDFQKILTENYFDLGTTSIGDYAKAFTDDENRDFTELNNRILEMLQSDSKGGIIEENLNGLLETVDVYDNHIIYKLESKIYKFK